MTVQSSFSDAWLGIRTSQPEFQLIPVVINKPVSEIEIKMLKMHGISKRGDLRHC